MLLRASVLALTMITTLATAALVSTPASASFSFGRGIHDDWTQGRNATRTFVRSIHAGASHGFQCCRKHPT
jgi:hypothetical protein